MTPSDTDRKILLRELSVKRGESHWEDYRQAEAFDISVGKASDSRKSQQPIAVKYRIITRHDQTNEKE